MKIIKIFLLLLLFFNINLALASSGLTISGTGTDVIQQGKLGDNININIFGSGIHLYPSNSIDYVKNNKFGYLTWLTKLIDSEQFGNFYITGGLIELSYTGSNNCDIPGERTLLFSGSLYNKKWGEYLTIDSDKTYLCEYSGKINIVLSSNFFGEVIIGNSKTFTESEFLDEIKLYPEKLRASDQNSISVNGLLIKDTNNKGLVNQSNTKNYGTVGGDIMNFNTVVNKNIILLTKGLTPKTSFSKLGNFNEDLAFYDYSGKEGTVSNEDNKGKILQIGNGGTINDNTGDYSKIMVSGQKTLIVKGGNIYINADIYNDKDNKNSLLTIIVKRDEQNNKNGGNIYINPNVTNIDAVLIADGSIINTTGTVNSTNGEPDSDFKIWTTLDDSNNTLKRQLLIYGAISTKNTIGEDKMPYGSDGYIRYGKNSTNGIEKYSLKYLRSFQISADGISSQNDEKYVFAGKKESKITDSTIDGLRGTMKSNSLVIEYNSIIQVNPPKILQSY